MTGHMCDFLSQAGLMSLDRKRTKTRPTRGAWALLSEARERSDVSMWAMCRLSVQARQVAGEDTLAERARSTGNRGRPVFEFLLVLMLCISLISLGLILLRSLVSLGLILLPSLVSLGLILL